MGITLVINPGSASKKYSFVQDGRELATFRFERNEQDYEVCREVNSESQLCEGITAEEYATALSRVITLAVNDGVIHSGADITCVGVRVVAPGTFFQSHQIIDAAYVAELEAKAHIAPLHIPATVHEVKEIFRTLPQALLVGVSDSQFHAAMPAKARELPLSHTDIETFDLHRFGYHGISYASIVRRWDRALSQKPVRAIICHIGSGMSMCAVRNGQSIDTSMGFAPGCGLMMGARAGDVEPALVLEIMSRHALTVELMQAYLQSQSGFQGLVGESDFRHLLDRYQQEDASVQAAFQQCVYRFQKTLGSYVVALGGLDAVILTGTAVERNPFLRSLLLEGLQCLGVTINHERNDETIATDGVISDDGALVRVSVMRTHEALEIANVVKTFVY